MLEGETARVPGPMRPGFCAELGLDSQAAPAPLPHGHHSKLQGHARRREKHGVYASVDRKAQIPAPHEFGQQSTRQADSSWPNFHGGLPVATQVPVPRALVSGVARSILAPPSAHREHRASLPVPTTRETVEASPQTAHRARVRKCSFLRPQLPQTPSWKSM